jgi:hypothetical protein
MKYIKRFNESVTEEELENVLDISQLQIDDVVYYKQRGEFIKGFVGDDFGDGKFFIFDKKIKLEPDYADNDFELYQDERPELQRNLYKLR